MTLFDKIKAVYPELTEKDWFGKDKTFTLRNDGDERGDYIESWTHPTLPMPTEKQLSDVA